MVRPPDNGRGAGKPFTERPPPGNAYAVVDFRRSQQSLASLTGDRSKSSKSQAPSSKEASNSKSQLRQSGIKFQAPKLEVRRAGQFLELGFWIFGFFGCPGLTR